MGATLVILAAGSGQRFGGLKQLEPVGAAGAALVDYTIYDALRAGFNRIVFVIRPEMQADFQARFEPRYANRAAVAFAQQRLDAGSAVANSALARIKPWGTGHAVLAAADAVAEPFAVANADDYYGPVSLAVIHEFLTAPLPGGVPVHGLVGYTLGNTLPDQGAVARAVCTCTPDGWLESIAEITGIERCGVAGICVAESDEARPLCGDEIVSMNLWGFFPSIFAELRAGFQRFLSAYRQSPDAEFYLPAVVQQLLVERRARVRIMPTPDKWCGMTHPADRGHVVEFLAALRAQRVYPEQLWD